MQPPHEPRRKRLRVIEGGNNRVAGNPGGPEFGSGIKAEEARDERKPLTAEEIDDMHRMDRPSKE